ncbi:carboxylesterase [Rhizobium sp. L1K21]|uniref:alpha/beta hydrolase n=1 Tax=Rhizobium sp. L1K21 TaxID=2954933 RepID=UPI0020933DCA|nr:alpha/beta hydrolase [Rhizobium sp. L1K21]MCO6187420.1 alpha/beta hydrolase [Rhizobium sp. L1K21]
MTVETPQFIKVGAGTDAREIAYRIAEPAPGSKLPQLVWLGGYRSDMRGTKAVELEAHAKSLGAGCLRLDYSGHGESGGDFMDGCISRWLEDALAVIRQVGAERLVLVGSSMGGWIALRALQELLKAGGPQKVVGMLLIAPAPDFTQELMEPELTDKERDSMAARGYFEEPSQYSDEPNIYTRLLMEDGKQNLVLSGIIDTGCAVHIVQGMQDPDVPYTHALKLLDHLPADDVVLTMVRDGDHRLSRAQDIALLKRAAEGLLTA